MVDTGKGEGSGEESVEVESVMVVEVMWRGEVGTLNVVMSAKEAEMREETEAVSGRERRSGHTHLPTSPDPCTHMYLLGSV